MKLSTVAELAGFGLLAYAAYCWQPLVGLAVAGVFLLLIGYATEDAVVGLSMAKLVQPLVRLRIRFRSRHQEG